MTLYNVIITRRTDGSKSILEYNITEAQAEKMCEEWGWMYDDGRHSYYMSYEESHITDEMLETIENSTLADLYDAYDIETDEQIKLAIKTEIGEQIQ